ncbi:DNase I-like protein [Violaceomyces palustris]|uniref:DNase I-like protein n=1 Tax=Violaceomyces palustris TaxID=1673888 RepID=A0ACD0P846_9BASI|nr:DNase I-like protein [Violaceomyces palustris]
MVEGERADPYIVTSTLLTPDEHLKIAISAEASPSSSYRANAALGDERKRGHTDTSQRIFSIVSNVSSNSEQACILLLRPRLTLSTKNITADVLKAIPILAGLRIEIEQLKPQHPSSIQAVVESDRVKRETKAPLPIQKPSSLGQHGIRSFQTWLDALSTNLQTQLSVNPPPAATTSLKFSFISPSTDQLVQGITSDAQGLKDLLTVAKDLLKIAEDNAFAIPVTHKWVRHYTDEIDFSPKHKALGEGQASGASTTPIFSRFSKSAFLPSTQIHGRGTGETEERPRSPSEQEVSITIGTFNVNGQVPNVDSDLEHVGRGANDLEMWKGLREWLKIDLENPDLLVLGFQEFDTSSAAYLYYSPLREEAWTKAVRKAMGASKSRLYTKIASKQLVGLLIMVFARTELVPYISEIETSSVGVGLGGFVANKGATAVRFCLEGRTFCFVNSHLSAFDGINAMERRCWDIGEIMKRLKFRVPLESDSASELREKSERKAEESIEAGSEVELEAEAVAEAEETSTGAISVTADMLEDAKEEVSLGDEGQPTLVAVEQKKEFVETKEWRMEEPELVELSIMDHDLIFWFGDLNFRLDLAASEVDRLIKARKLSLLHRYDQLEMLRKNGIIFSEFEEGPIGESWCRRVGHFNPTYKFDKGTDDYDTSEKRRCPAWTDRILWCINSDDYVDTHPRGSSPFEDQLPSEVLDGLEDDDDDDAPYDGVGRGKGGRGRGEDEEDDYKEINEEWDYDNLVTRPSTDSESKAPVKKDGGSPSAVKESDDSASASEAREEKQVNALDGDWASQTSEAERAGGEKENGSGLAISTSKGSRTKGIVDLQSYESVPTIKISDHKPVRAHFVIRVL